MPALDQLDANRCVGPAGEFTQPSELKLSEALSRVHDRDGRLDLQLRPSTAANTTGT